MYAIHYTVLSASIYGNSHRILEGKSTIIIYGIGNLTHHYSQLDIYNILLSLRVQIVEPVWVHSVQHLNLSAMGTYTSHQTFVP